jgi:hypothetical protein
MEISPNSSEFLLPAQRARSFHILTIRLTLSYTTDRARFDLPQPPLPLRGLQNATVFGPACPQQALSPLPISFPNNDGLISEACMLPSDFENFSPI